MYVFFSPLYILISWINKISLSSSLTYTALELFSPEEKPLWLCRIFCTETKLILSFTMWHAKTIKCGL